MLVIPALVKVFMMIAIGFNESFCVELFSNAASNAESELDALEEAELLVLLELVPDVLELLLESSDEPTTPP